MSGTGRPAPDRLTTKFGVSGSLLCTVNVPVCAFVEVGSKSSVSTQLSVPFTAIVRGRELG